MIHVLKLETNSRALVAEGCLLCFCSCDWSGGVYSSCPAPRSRARLEVLVTWSLLWFIMHTGLLFIFYWFFIYFFRFFNLRNSHHRPVNSFSMLHFQLLPSWATSGGAERGQMRCPVIQAKAKKKTKKQSRFLPLWKGLGSSQTHQLVESHPPTSGGRGQPWRRGDPIITHPSSSKWDKDSQR